MRTADNRIWRLKVTLSAVKPVVWRRIEVPGSVTLARLHEILLDTMGWMGGHLHAFQSGDNAWGDRDEEWGAGPGVFDERRMSLARLAPEVGDSFEYLYDFGDGWSHKVKVEAIHAPVMGGRYPRCTAGARACPPDDIGGPWGYREFLEALVDPDHERHEEMLEWHDGPFDPQAFDIETVNSLIIGAWRSPADDAETPIPPARPSVTRSVDLSKVLPPNVPAGLPVLFGRVSTNGQVTIPKPVRDQLGLHPGTDVIFVPMDRFVFLLKDPS